MCRDQPRAFRSRSARRAGRTEAGGRRRRSRRRRRSYPTARSAANRDAVPANAISRVRARASLKLDGVSLPGLKVERAGARVRLDHVETTRGGRSTDNLDGRGDRMVELKRLAMEVAAFRAKRHHHSFAGSLARFRPSDHTGTTPRHHNGRECCARSGGCNALTLQ